jgi:hypothetical protein
VSRVAPLPLASTAVSLHIPLLDLPMKLRSGHPALCTAEKPPASGLDRTMPEFLKFHRWDTKVVVSTVSRHTICTKL